MSPHEATCVGGGGGGVGWKKDQRMMNQPASLWQKCGMRQTDLVEASDSISTFNLVSTLLYVI